MPNNPEITTCMTKLWGSTQTCSTEAYAQSLRVDHDQVQTVTLTFDLATWFLHMTHHLVIIIICTVPSNFQIPPCHTKLWADTNRFHGSRRTSSANCDLDFWPSNMVHTWDTSSCHDDHLCQIIFRTVLWAQKSIFGIVLEGKLQSYSRIS